MQNIFMPSDTIACIEQKYVGKTYRIQGKAYSEPFTKEKIKALFDVYVGVMDSVFGGRALVMQRTRALKGGTIVPITSYEYVYDKKRSITTYVDEGYYALTINGYRVRDILDSGYHYFEDSLAGGKRIIQQLASILDVKEKETKYVLLDFFFDNQMETFDAFLASVMHHGKTDVYTFDVCASLMCSFGEPLPAIGDPVEIQVMSRAAQDRGLAVDEVDVDGWKSGKCPGRDKNDFVNFFEDALKHCPDPAVVEESDDDANEIDEEEIDEEEIDEEDDREEDNVPADNDDEEDEWEKDEDSDCGNCSDPGGKHCCECNGMKESDPVDECLLNEIRKDVNADKKHRVEIKDEEESDGKRDENQTLYDKYAPASDGQNYYYCYTYVGPDGKSHTKSYFGDEAKKKIEEDSQTKTRKSEDDHSKDTVGKMNDRLMELDIRLKELEELRNRRRPVIRSPWSQFNDLFRDIDSAFDW